MTPMTKVKKEFILKVLTSKSNSRIPVVFIAAVISAMLRGYTQTQRLMGGIHEV
jgi:hypothetical protein